MEIELPSFPSALTTEEAQALDHFKETANSGEAGWHVVCLSRIFSTNKEDSYPEGNLASL